MLTPIQIEDLNKWIEDAYGTTEKLAKHLDELIFMLHYLEEAIFTRREIQSTADMLQALGEVLRE